MQWRKTLYLEVGALEFWVCRENGNMSFFDSSGQLEVSSLIPSFPKIVKIIG